MNRKCKLITQLIVFFNCYPLLRQAFFKFIVIYRNHIIKHLNIVIDDSYHMIYYKEKMQDVDVR